MSTGTPPKQNQDVSRRAFGMFQASRDYFSAWEVLQLQRPPRERQQYVAWPWLSQVLLATIALELALKSLITLGGGTPHKTHHTERLFRQLDGTTQHELAERLAIQGKNGAPSAVLDALRELDNGAPGSGKGVPPFEAFRYLFEHREARYAAQTIEVLTRVIHKMLVQRRSDWARWPGIIAS